METIQNVTTKNFDQTNTVNASGNSYKSIAQSNDIQGDGNFLQGCSFSPDGLCVLTHTVADAKLRLYNTPLQSPQINGDLKHDVVEVDTATIPKQEEWTTILSSHCGDSVRSYAWYPLMNSSDPGTCCFVAASRYVRLFAIMFLS